MRIPTLMCDFYKVSHREQYPDGTENVYSTWTPRSNKYFQRTDKVIAFGFQGFIRKYIIEFFNEYFFSVPLEEVLDEYKRYIKYCLNIENPDTSHIEELWNIGFIPLKIMAVPEGSNVPIKCPMLTIENTNPKFFWLTNYFETLMSCELWGPSTSATIAYEYRKILDGFAEATSDCPEMVQFQGHDFSMRGMNSLGSSETSGAGHLLSFVGTDTIPAIMYLEEYYDANIENELVGCSVPATEHSVMCAGGFDNEFQTYERLITETYPSGIVSIVSDTWDLWSCVENIIKPLKDKIISRNGKVVIRPDSGDPVKIITGYTDEELRQNFLFMNGNWLSKEGKILSESEIKGLCTLLWEIFGGTVNSKGYKDLDSHIGMIYGDSITPERCEQISQRLKNKGFASTNMVYGIGSYTYQYNTRDTFGFALKSTYCIINGEEKMIFKNPSTDDGTKKSNTGLVKVIKDSNNLKCIDGLMKDSDFSDNIMQVIYSDGFMYNQTSLSEIRNKILNK